MSRILGLAFEKLRAIHCACVRSVCCPRLMDGHVGQSRADAASRHRRLANPGFGCAEVWVELVLEPVTLHRHLVDMLPKFSGLGGEDAVLAAKAGNAVLARRQEPPRVSARVVRPRDASRARRNREGEG